MSHPKRSDLAAGTALPNNVIDISDQADIEEHQIGAGSWDWVDLSQHADGNGEPPPDLLPRTDSHNLFYRNKIHWISGEPESGKSWLALIGAAHTVQNGGHAWYIDFEDSPASIVSRFQALGLTLDQITRDIYYSQPDDALFDHRGEDTAHGLGWRYQLTEAVQQRRPDFVVVDGVTESLAVHGLDHDNHSVAKWINGLLKPIRDTTGAATAVIDHVTKSTEGRNRWAIGGQHKLAATDVAFIVDSKTPIGRAQLGDDEGRTGISQISLSKDRPGHHRGLGVGRGEPLADLRVTSYPDGGISWELQPPNTTKAPDDVPLQAAIIHYLTQYEGASKRNIEEGVTGSAAKIREQIQVLVNREFIAVQKVGQSHQHTVTDEGAEWYAEAQE